MKEFLLRELTKKESDLIFSLIGVIGVLIAVIAARWTQEPIALVGDYVWFWVGCDLAFCGLAGVVVPRTHGEEE